MHIGLSVFVCHAQLDKDRQKPIWQLSFSIALIGFPARSRILFLYLYVFCPSVKTPSVKTVLISTMWILMSIDSFDFIRSTIWKTKNVQVNQKRMLNCNVMNWKTQQLRMFEEFALVLNQHVYTQWEKFKKKANRFHFLYLEIFFHMNCLNFKIV